MCKSSMKIPVDVFNDWSDSEEEKAPVKKRKLFVPNLRDSSATVSAAEEAQAEEADLFVEYDEIVFELPEEEVANYEQLQEKKRKQGLEKSILSEDSVGMKIMMKMGYKQGDSLGKESERKQKQKIIDTPIQLSSKQDNSGVGKDSRYDGYMSGKSKESEEQRQMRKLMKQAFVLSKDADAENLDSVNPLDVNVLWREYLISIQEEMRAGRIVIIESSKQKVEEKQTTGNTYNKEDDTELQDFNKETLSQRIFMLVTYLRTQWYYCLYCGTQYADEKQLYEMCPGITSEEHY